MDGGCRLKGKSAVDWSCSTALLERGAALLGCPGLSPRLEITSTATVRGS